MKSIFRICVLALLVIFSSVASAEEYGPDSKRIGFGIVAGDPTGITAKGYIGPKLAIDGIASWSFVDEAFTLIGDVTYEFFNLSVNSNTVSVPFYAGAGAKLAFDQGGKNNGKTAFGIRAPVGIAVQWLNHPVEIFIEAGPGVEVAPSTEFDLTGGIGARYYF